MIMYYWAQKESGLFLFTVLYLGGNLQSGTSCDGRTNPEEIYAQILCGPEYF